MAEISQDYTLSEEGEGANISGNKELRNEGDNEDENNSKRAKGPLQPPIAELEKPHQLDTERLQPLISC